MHSIYVFIVDRKKCNCFFFVCFFCMWLYFYYGWINTEKSIACADRRTLFLLRFFVKRALGKLLLSQSMKILLAIDWIINRIKNGFDHFSGKINLLEFDRNEEKEKKSFFQHTKWTMTTRLLCTKASNAIE